MLADLSSSLSAGLEKDLNIFDFFELSPLGFRDSYITIGNFDGVHRGHQAIICKMIQSAKEQNRPILIVTFFPNPADYFNPELDAFYLSTPKEKEGQLLKLGVDRVITFRFDRDFANLPPRAFLSGLKHNLGLSKLVVGQDFALGKNRAGTLPIIKEIGQEMSFSVETIEPVDLGGEEISSTKIRQRLAEGRVADAAEMLGRPYTVSGEVTHGSDRGSRIGLPTANLTPWKKKKLPAVGVYATRVLHRGIEYSGLSNIGFRPTFEKQTLPNMETHILGFDGNIYGEKLTLKFIGKIRDEQKFSGVDAFLAQIERDKDTARRIFSDDET